MKLKDLNTNNYILHCQNYNNLFTLVISQIKIVNNDTPVSHKILWQSKRINGLWAIGASYNFPQEYADNIIKKLTKKEVNSFSILTEEEAMNQYPEYFI